MIMKHLYVNFKVTMLHFYHTNVKYGTVFLYVYGNLLDLIFGLCCKGVLYVQIVAHIIAVFLKVYQDFVSYIVSYIMLTSLHQVVCFFFYLFIFFFLFFKLCFQYNEFPSISD
jgi:hypothetical protein